MILPVPSMLLDVGLAVSFSLAVLIFTVTLFVEKPLDFSSFPTMLLGALVLRLALNVSSTRLIISEGHTGTDAAGDVIDGFAHFIMGGNVFLGLVIFTVLLIVNFLVITKGASRMAEVGARFALDGMPGKQLAIDSDIAAGALDHQAAKERRAEEQQETTFFGSLDGASKFVKGDAVAGLLITALNLIVGVLMGVFAHDLPLGLAFETYAILTVGDGLVTQIPAVIISIASALLLARGGERRSTDVAILDQLGRHPEPLMAVSLLLVLFALVPGLPFLPFIASAVVMGLAGAFLMQRTRSMRLENELPMPISTAASKPIGDTLDVDDLHIEFAPDLVSMILDPSTGIEARIENMRTHIAENFGIILPDIRLTDRPSLPLGTYILRIHGVEYQRGVLHPDLLLALVPEDGVTLPDGTDVVEPVYGAPARWIQARYREEVALDGITIVTPGEILATHLLEVIKKNLSRLLTLKSLRRLLSELTHVSDPIRGEANRKFLDELVPDKVSIDALHSVLRLLLDEQVSIRNLPLILEAIAEARVFTTQPEAICEHVRQRMSFQLLADLKREDGSVPLIQLASEWEDQFATYQVESDRGGFDIALPPDAFSRLSSGMSEQVNTAADKGIFAAVVTTMRRRRYLQTVLKSTGLSNPVLSFEELGVEARPALIGVVPP